MRDYGHQVSLWACFGRTVMIPFTDVGRPSPQCVVPFPGSGSRLYSRERESSTGAQALILSALDLGVTHCTRSSVLGFPAMMNCDLQLLARLTLSS